MAHKGRPYPYSKSYWSTEGWFWPGFCPWKCSLEITVAEPEWGIVAPIPGHLVSDPSTVTDDRRTIRYRWPMSVEDSATDLFLECYEKLYVSGDYCVQRIWSEDDGVKIKEAFQFLPFPQRVFVQGDPDNFKDTDDPTAPPQSYNIFFGWTSYGDGGSPWD